MSLLRLLFACLAIFALSTAVIGCGDDDYNSDGASTVDQSATIHDMAQPPSDGMTTTDGG